MKEFVAVEQVGFLSYPQDSSIDARLDMMGGEFCVNGLRCAATMIASEKRLKNIRLGSSGTDQVFNCQVVMKNGRFNTSIALTILPKVRLFALNNFFIELNGISHLLCEFSERDCIDSLSIFDEYRKKFSRELSSLPAFGIVPFQRSSNGFAIFPTIYVRDTDTTIQETACGSASMSLAILKMAEASMFSITQPSDSTYEIEILKRKNDFKITLSSFVDIIDSGTVDI